MPSAFPTTIRGLYNYLEVVNTYLIDNAVRLGIDPIRLSAFISLFGDQNTTDTYLWCYHQWNDTGSGKTQVVNLKLSKISASLKTMLSEIFNDIPASRWTEKDRLVLNRKKGLPYIKTSHEAPIDEKMFANVEPLQHGLYWITVRPGSQTGRCHIPSGADSVEVAWVILDKGYRTNIENDPRVRKSCKSPEDNTNRYVSFRSRFQLQLDAQLAGFKIQMWFRWTHSRHPKRAGNWSHAIITSIG